MLGVVGLAPKVAAQAEVAQKVGVQIGEAD
jgi:hypothetical protein